MNNFLKEFSWAKISSNQAAPHGKGLGGAHPQELGKDLNGAEKEQKSRKETDRQQLKAGWLVVVRRHWWRVDSVNWRRLQATFQLAYTDHRGIRATSVQWPPCLIKDRGKDQSSSPEQSSMQENKTGEDS